MSAAQVFLKAGKERSLQRRHPWIYAGSVGRIVGNPGSGDTVAIRAPDGRFLAWAAFSPESSIRARLWTVDQATLIDRDFFRARIARAIAAREPLAQRTSARRLIFGEADGLPGLVVDRYGDQLVAQFLSAGVDLHKQIIADALTELTGCPQLYERSDAAVRAREGLPSIEAVLRGQEPAEFIEVQEDGIRYLVDVRKGHKTGFYIDQRESRACLTRVMQLMRTQRPQAPLRVLNCFSYTGGFSMAALAGGASEAISVDSSGDALSMARRHAELNGFTALQAPTCDESVFDALKRLEVARERFDAIVLDPPKFAPSAQHVDRAARAYKEINLRGLRLLNEGGYLLTFSCSGAINVELFQQIVAGAVMDSGRDAQLLQRLAAGWDHPMAMVHPEGEYLKGLLLRVS